MRPGGRRSTPHWAWEEDGLFALAQVDAQGVLEKGALGTKLWDHLAKRKLPRNQWTFAAGQLVNLVAGDGHPAEIMDLSFAVQLLSLLRLARDGKDLPPGVYPVAAEVDEDVARRFLATRGVRVNTLTPAQRAYLGLHDDTGP